jgi:hypothetical protein
MTRPRLAIALVIVAALLPAAGVWLDVLRHPDMLRRRADPISVFEHRIAPLRGALRGSRVVGYLPPQHIEHSVSHLYTLRYALAPIRVSQQSDLPLVVADGVSDRRLLPPLLRVRHDFGHGLLLLEPSAP